MSCSGIVFGVFIFKRILRLLVLFLLIFVLLLLVIFHVQDDRIKCHFKGSCVVLWQQVLMRLYSLVCSWICDWVRSSSLLWCSDLLLLYHLIIVCLSLELTNSIKSLHHSTLPGVPDTLIQLLWKASSNPSCSVLNHWELVKCRACEIRGVFTDSLDHPCDATL